MSDPTKLPLQAVIFDRTQRGESDVPIFASVYAKVQTSHPAISIPTPEQTLTSQALLGTQNPQSGAVLSSHPNTTEVRPSTLLGDSTASGQALPVEFPKSAEAVDFSYLREDPTLIRLNLSSEKLVSYIQTRPVLSQATILKKVHKPDFPPVVISPLEGLHLAQAHSAGLIDLAVLPDTIRIAPFGEEHVYVLRRLYKQLSSQIEKLADILQSQETQTSIRKKRDRITGQVEAHIAIIVQAIGKLVQKILSIVGGVRQKATSFSFPRPEAVSISLSFPRGTPREDNGVLEESVRDQTNDLLGKIKDQLRALQTLFASYRRSIPTVPRLASNVMLILSIVFMLMSVGPILMLEGYSLQQRIVHSLSSKADDVATQSATTTTSSPVEATPIPTPTIAPSPDTIFQLQIPKIGADMKVIPNVDPANEKEYTAALKQGVAHAKGTNLPGESSHTKTIYIFGHSTNGTWNIQRYNALFYNLKDLVPGDIISVWFWGKKYDYAVTDKKTLAADDVSYLQPQTEKDQLVLQTCWPPGTSWKRLLVIAEPIPN